MAKKASDRVRGQRTGRCDWSLRAARSGCGQAGRHRTRVDFYEAEFTIEELVQLVFEDLHLPNLQEKGTKDILADQVRFDTIARRGLLPIWIGSAR
jgi:uncharacterized sporulation protein YeaH/YhbH (DUF444 family)